MFRQSVRKLALELARDYHDNQPSRVIELLNQLAPGYTERVHTLVGYLCDYTWDEIQAYYRTHNRSMPT